MTDLTAFPNCGLGWLNADGEHADIVLSTRVRLARNLQGHRFAPKADASDRESILDHFGAATARVRSLRDGTTFEMRRLEPRLRRLLLERRIATRELLGETDERSDDGARAVYVCPSSSLSVMVNEEDHIRIQGLMSGLRIHETWRDVDRLDDELGGELPFAFDRHFGFLTSCPTNVGSGLRASVFMHLPGLVLTKEIGRVLEGLSEVGLTFRGLYGEGSEVVGNFFQVSNERTLGRAEEDILTDLDGRVRHVIRCERRAREVLLSDARAVTEDKIWRAFGLLRYARSVSFEELMSLLSGVRLGASLQLLPAPGVYTLNKMMVLTQAAHLEEAVGRDLAAPMIDHYRASYVRRALSDELGHRSRPVQIPDSGPRLPDRSPGGPAKDA